MRNKGLYAIGSDYFKHTYLHWLVWEDTKALDHLPEIQCSLTYFETKQRLRLNQFNFFLMFFSVTLSSELIFETNHCLIQKDLNFGET